MELSKFDKVVALCTKVDIHINKEVISPSEGITPDQILRSDALYQAFGFKCVPPGIRAKMIRTNTAVIVTINLKQQHGNVTLINTEYKFTSYSLEHVVDEVYGMLELLGLVE